MRFIEKLKCKIWGHLRGKFKTALLNDKGQNAGSVYACPRCGDCWTRKSYRRLKK